MTTGSLIVIGVLQALLIAVVAPLYSGFARVLRAKMHSRHGPSILQNYRDLIKLMKRQEILPAQGNLVFRITPYLTIVSVLLIAMIIPILVTQSPFGWVGDMILVIYLLVLIRFFTSLSGLASGSTFGGVGARRELFVSALIEPLMLLVLFVMALLAGSTNLGVISTGVVTGALPYYATVWLGMISFAFVVFVEAGKLPFDLSEAEQELQEGALTEYSGPRSCTHEVGIVHETTRGRLPVPGCLYTFREHDDLIDLGRPPGAARIPFEGRRCCMRLPPYWKIPWPDCAS